MDGLFVGRFQPFHKGHLHAIHYALERAIRLHVGIGSSDAAPSARNPFSAAERYRMVESCVDPERVSIFEVPDYHDHSRWAAHIARAASFEVVFTNDEQTRHVYERRGVDTMAVPFEERRRLSGTNVRRLLGTGGDWRPLVPDGAGAVLDEIGAAARLAPNYK